MDMFTMKLPFDPVSAVCLIAIIIGVIYGIVTGSWNPVIWIVLVSMIVFCLRSVLTDAMDGGKKTEGSEAYDCGFEDPADITLICPKDTFGIDPFYIYCLGKCVAKICRGDELIIKVPKGAVDLGIIRIDGMTPRKYVHMLASGGERVYVYPDDDSMLPYTLHLQKEGVPDNAIFEEHYKKQKSGSIRISLGILIFVALAAAIIIVFFKPF